jgi:hypothetical protein
MYIEFIYMDSQGLWDFGKTHALLIFRKKTLYPQGFNAASLHWILTQTLFQQS